ncbi:hypothetical protein D3C78_1148950 [compost metagenome]
MGGVGVHHAAKLGIGAIEHQVGGGVGGGAQAPLDLPAGEIQHHQIFEQHAVVADTARLDDHQIALAIDTAHIAPGEGHQAVARQIQVGGQHLLLECAQVHARSPRL